jgi:hypothetical protein
LAAGIDSVPTCDSTRTGTSDHVLIGRPEGSWYSEQLKQLGPHTTGVGCLHIKDLETVDLSVLETIVVESYRTVTDGT